MRIILTVALLGITAAAHADFMARVTHVRDADTIECGQRVVRLQGIDAPELDQPHGRQATQALRARILGKRVTVETEGRGKYGRIIGVVVHDGHNLNAWLVRRGHAWAYDRYLGPGSPLPDLERAAQNAGRGLWAAADPVPPWQWRHGGQEDPSPSGPDRDCSDFSSQAAAQRFFDRHGPGDPHRLDGDGDGEACESLP